MANDDVELLQSPAGQTGQASGAADRTGSTAARLIVAIGASAGGLAAFKAFFAAMPADSGMAFVLVQHLDPNHRSLLAELVARQTGMPVDEAADGTPVAANRIYVIPPDATLSIAAGVLHVTRPAPPRQRRWPIDGFFTSLAEDQGERAVCIVLAGTGSDGSLGLRVVKTQGGLTLAQAETDHHAMSGMPSSAAATGLVDHVLAVEAMPALLLNYARHLGEIGAQKDGDGSRTDTADHLGPITTLLRTRLGHDFSQYKPATVVRRIQRRMQVLQIEAVPTYIDRLRSDPAELDLLFRELLIGVTEFFRDPAAFAALRVALVAELLANHTDAGPIRVWVPACSTGEEVYSIAILLREEMDRLGIVRPAQIFGTDIDDTAITTARAGQYRRVMAGMSVESVARWFVEDGDVYRVAKSLREMCVFSTHSVLKDPPFFRLDLISCRNLLIYLDSELQERVIRTFHYALQPGGVLFVGPSEGVSHRGDLFAAIDARHRVFRRSETALPSRLPEFPHADGPRAGATGASPRRPPSSDDSIERRTRAALEKYSPAYLVIDAQQAILRFSGGAAGRYLEPTTGTASLSLFGMLRKSLRPAVRAALQKIAAGGDAVVQDNLRVELDGEVRAVSLIVEKLAGGNAGDERAGGSLQVIAFRDQGRAVRRRAASGAMAAGNATVATLERDLAQTQDQLQAAIDELESATDEAKSSGEEYQSVNEELQSSNEELETAKEEMQSVNEELQTINAELSSKNDLLTRLNSDMQNLLESTQIATIFLDGDLRIKGFTPAMTGLFHLRATDLSRPLGEITTRLAYDSLAQDIADVLGRSELIEREVQIIDAETTFLMRIRPYRTVDRVVDGVVITFVDITDRKRSEVTVSEHAAIVEFASDALLGISEAGRLRSWNPAAERLFGYSAEAAIGAPIAMLAAPDDAAAQAALVDQAREGAVAGPVETACRRRDGGLVEVELTVTPIRGADRRVVALAAAARDISGRKDAERQRLLLQHELSHRIKNALATVQAMMQETIRSAPTLDAFREAFTARLLALSTTHDLLIRGAWESAALRDVVAAELRPYGGEDARWTADGPDVRLPPKMALALGMGLHELATNAAKYGALSAAGGQVAVTWRTRNRRLHLSWIESGGPAVAQPTRTGFGSRLIADGLALELEGDARIEFLPAGVRCSIEVPWTPLEGRA